MSLASLEREIVEEAKKVSGDSTLTLKRLMEWRNAEIKPQEGETTHYLPDLGVWATFANPKPKGSKK